MKINSIKNFIAFKFALVIFLLMLQSCENKPHQKHPETVTNKVDSNKNYSDSVRNEKKFPEQKTTNNEFFDVNEMRFNGKLRRFFSLEEFENVFGKADSTKLMSEEEPCSYVFENPDGSKDMDDRYLYKNGSRFENNQQKVAIDEFRFYKNSFLKYKGVILNSETNIQDLKKLFPNAVTKIGTLDVYGEGKLQVIELREDENNISDGHIKVFLKNGKLYFMHWWFPC
ncbi:hypothetical protein [Chryseobacterium sp. 2R14A]|uniref:hypothetical protein n=1 Tax=Chryseobacterium sp. 2R14A TaxID=3380353 RepID=UPI003CEFF82B